MAFESSANANVWGWDVGRSISKYPSEGKFLCAAFAFNYFFTMAAAYKSILSDAFFMYTSETCSEKKEWRMSRTRCTSIKHKFTFIYVCLQFAMLESTDFLFLLFFFPQRVFPQFSHFEWKAHKCEQTIFSRDAIFIYRQRSWNHKKRIWRRICKYCVLWSSLDECMRSLYQVDFQCVFSLNRLFSQLQF